MRKLKKYKPTPFMAEGSHYDKAVADYAVMFMTSSPDWRRPPTSSMARLRSTAMTLSAG